MGKLLESNRILFAAYGVLAVAGLVVVLNSMMDYSAGSATKAIALLAVLALLPAAVLFVFLLTKNKQEPEKVFLLVAIPVLSCFALFILPNHVPDEIWHIFRVFSIENPGNAMVAPLAFLPSSLPENYSELRELCFSSISWADTMDLDRDMSTYLAHLYLVPGLVVKLCAVINVNPFVAIYLARFTNAALFCVAGYWIIKIMPMAKVMTCVYLLNPLMIQQEASCSADAVTNIITLLFVAALVRARFQDKLTLKYGIVLVILFVFTALSKYAYVLLAYLFLLLVPKIEDKRKRVAIYTGTAVVTLVAAAFVLCFASSESYQDTLDLLRNPADFIWVMKNTFIEMTPNWMQQFLGSALSNLDVNPWWPCVFAYGLALAFSVVFNFGETLSLKRIEKIGIVILVSFVTTAIILIFRHWTLSYDLRSDVIMGFQGRYMLPYLILLPLCFSTPRASLVRTNCLVIYSSILLCIYAFDMVAIIGAFA